MSGDVIIVTGIPGVGKTTILKELERVCSGKGRSFDIVTYSTIMLEVAERGSLTVVRDGLRHLSIDSQKSLQTRAAEKISELSKKQEITIVDTHMHVRTEDGFWVGLPLTVLNLLKPSLFILVEANPDDILARRARDQSRERDSVLRTELEREIAFSRSVAATCATLTGSPVKFVENLPGKQVQVAQQLYEIIWRKD